MKKPEYVIGVDVGTGSARAGVFDREGTLLASAVEPIEMWRPKPEYAEQSSADIWRAVCEVVRTSRKKAKVAAEAVLGIAFDATCSLVVLDRDGKPLAVNDERDHNRNIIVWMDHRATAETEAINAGKHSVLKYVGGRLSPEMETPKLKWLKTHLSETWSKAGKFFDLADFLVYRSTEVDVRSLCTVVCKWTYLGHEGKRGKWDRTFFKKVGLEDLFAEDKVIDNVRPLGERVGTLTPTSAKELGLTSACAVSVGIIDAHAGGLGLLGAVWGDGRPQLQKLEGALALIAGTSNCHMAVSREPRYINGVWGPYYGAMVPGMWLTEGGQSTAGSAIDHVISDHSHAPVLRAAAKKNAKTVYELLNEEIAKLQTPGRGPEVVKDLHVLPYFLGNRSPHADPHARAIVDGMTLDESLASQALRYYATIQAVAYGTRDIIAAMNDAGYRIRKVFVTGGATKNPLWLQEQADATGCTVVLPREPDAVLLGSAMLAAAASRMHSDVLSAMHIMSGTGRTIEPRPATAAYHRAKFKLFQELYREQRRRRAAMSKF
jgi:FGGY-family pentulose kinase